MKIPIPGDWDGESWRCIQLQWPNSLGWNIILNGILTGMHRGRFWDERSGSILDVQEIAHEIERRNFPWTFCSGDKQTPDEIIEIINAGGCGCISALEGWQMACLDLTNLIKIADGKLWVRDSCCEWHEVTSDGGGISSGGGATGTWEEPPDIDYEYTDVYPCGMAEAFAEKMHQVGEFIWDNCPLIQSILMVFAVQQDSNLDLNNVKVIEATNQALIMQGIVLISADAVDLSEQDILESDWDSEVACAMLPFMGADGTCDGDQLKSAFDSWVDRHYPITGVDDVDNVFIRNYWHYISDAVGAGNMRDIAQSGRYNEGDCDCIGVGDNPDRIDGDDGWYLGATQTILIVGTGGFTYGEGSIIQRPAEDVFGCMFEFQFVSGDEINRIKRSNACNYSPDFCMTTSNSDTFAVGKQYLQAGPIAYAAISPYLPSPEQKNLSGKTSDIVAAELATPLDMVEQRFAAQASGNEGEVFCTVRVNLRWLHNTGSDSHQ